MFPRERFCPILCTTVSSVTKLVNSIMLDGKKGVAQKVVYGAFDIIKEKTGKDPLEALPRRWKNIMPESGSQGPPCRRRHLSGPYGSSSRPSSDPRSALADELTPASAARRPWPSVWQARSWMPATTPAPP